MSKSPAAYRLGGEVVNDHAHRGDDRIGRWTTARPRSHQGPNEQVAKEASAPSALPSAQLQWQTAQIRCQRRAGEGRNAMEPADLLDQHGIKPGLEAMPAPPARRETLPRVQETLPRSCVVGGAPAAAARVVRFAGAGRAGWICAGTTGWRSVLDAAVGRSWRASPQTCGRRPRKPACRGIVAVVLFSVRSGCSWRPDRKPD